MDGFRLRILIYGLESLHSHVRQFASAMATASAEAVGRNWTNEKLDSIRKRAS